MALVTVNIGSNLGNRLLNIQSAVDMISTRFGICCISSYIESEPWGFESENRFLNLGVSFFSDLKPEEVLTELQKIEKSISISGHRNKKGEYLDREIDIDIMTINNLKYNSERLIIPHPHLQEREFFMKPLLELIPIEVEEL